MSAPFEQGERIAWVFPGQGSQAVGMGKALYDAFLPVRDLYDRADEVLGRPISSLCFEGPADELQQTANAQPALLVTELAHLEALRLSYAGDLPAPVYIAGHSLGEYSALVAAGALSFEDGLRLVAERGRLMQAADAGTPEPSGMSAVLGLPVEEVEAVCREAGVDLANLNAPDQVVISGPLAALETAAALSKERGAKRVVPLQVSAAFHSRWMRPMAREFGLAIAQTPVAEPRVPVVANVTALPVSDPSEVRRLLEEQTYSSVRWVESVRYMEAEGVTTFIEVGPGKVLSGLVRRIAPNARTLSSEELLA
ncbi:MAG TPA: ACP S-malonyltransferase [Chloroflexia bacterium]|nr:ACP S-malonyltransferase [Chloroflexia bacterium]